MATYKVTIDKVGSAIAAQSRWHQHQVKDQALYAAALRALPLVVKATPVDQGFARAGWTVNRNLNGATLANDAPHIGILERGARPYKPPLMPILRWVVRKFGLNMDGGRRSFNTIEDVPYGTYLVAKAIQERIEREGQKPIGMVSNNLKRMGVILKEEVEAILRRPLPPTVVGGGNG